LSIAKNQAAAKRKKAGNVRYRDSATARANHRLGPGPKKFNRTPLLRDDSAICTKQLRLKRRNIFVVFMNA